MPESTEPKERTARKPHECWWCGEAIQPGEQYVGWFCYRDPVAVKMHPECYRACRRTGEDYSDGLPEQGIYRRGCWCGEREEHCTCKEEPYHAR